MDFTRDRPPIIYWSQVAELNSKYNEERGRKNLLNEPMVNFLYKFNDLIRGSSVSNSNPSSSELSCERIAIHSTLPSHLEVTLAIQRIEFPSLFVKMNPEEKPTGIGNEGRVDVAHFQQVIKQANLIFSRLVLITFDPEAAEAKEAQTIHRFLFQRLEVHLTQARSHQHIQDRVNKIADLWFKKLILYARGKDKDKDELHNYQDVVKCWLFSLEKQIADLSYDLLKSELDQEDASADVLTKVDTLSKYLKKKWDELQPMIQILDQLITALADGTKAPDLTEDAVWQSNLDYVRHNINVSAKSIREILNGTQLSLSVEQRMSMLRQSHRYSTYSVISIASPLTEKAGAIPEGKIFFLDLLNDESWVNAATASMIDVISKEIIRPPFPKLSYPAENVLVRVHTIESMVYFKSKLDKDLESFCTDEGQRRKAKQDFSNLPTPSVTKEQKKIAKSELQPYLENSFFDAINRAFEHQMSGLIEETKLDLEQWLEVKKVKNEESEIPNFITLITAARKDSLFPFTLCRSNDDLRNARDMRASFDDFYAAFVQSLRKSPTADQKFFKKWTEYCMTLKAGQTAKRRGTNKGLREEKKA